MQKVTKPAVNRQPMALTRDRMAVSFSCTFCPSPSFMEVKPVIFSSSFRSASRSPRSCSSSAEI